jgi:hypothetical protein
MYDSVGQFYPWRKFASDTIHSGYLPLWNPYQFCGTPFVANSQSAVFYPGNLLFYILSPATAAGWSAFIHLILAASFMYVFLRGLGANQASGAVAGVAFAFSTWEISWLHLPTFLATSCWLPLILHLTRQVFMRPVMRVGLGLAVSVGMCLLAGHLQVAFYVLFAALLMAVWLAVGLIRNTGTRAALFPFMGWGIALGLGILLAGPQLVPTLELSRQSHRKGAPTAEGYKAYTDYSVHAAGLATLFIPDFFNNPSNQGARYFGISKGEKYFNYAEGAMYVGLLPAVLALFAVIRRRTSTLTPFLGVLAILSLLMALGTPIDALFYFHVPGFGQSGSPGRALILWTFAVASLSGIGMNTISITEKKMGRSAVGSLAVLGLVAAVALTLGMSIRNQNPGTDWDAGIQRQTVSMLLAGAVLMLSASGALRQELRAPAALILIGADLVVTGISYNPTAPAKEVYPRTQLTTYLKAHLGHDRIMPVNQNWSMIGPDAVLPPNGAMVYGLRDLQGYDSLFPGQYKAFMNRLAAPMPDSSPQEVGNMVFARNPGSPQVADSGVRLIISRQPLDLPGSKESFVDQVHVYELPSPRGRAYLETETTVKAFLEWLEDGATRISFPVNWQAPSTLHLADQFYAGWRADVDGGSVEIKRDNEVFRSVAVPSGRHTVSFRYLPASFAIGLFLSLVSGAFIAFLFAISCAFRAQTKSD